MPKAWKAAGAALLLAGAVIGCSKGPRTPKEAVLKAARALEKADGQTFADCFCAREDEKAYLKQLAEPMSRIMAFENAGFQAYGQEEWNAARGGRETKGGFPTVAELDRDLQVQIRGEWAACTVRDRKITLDLLNKDGAWLLRAGKLVPPAGQRERSIGLIQTVARIADEARAKIGREGMTAKKVRQELTQAVVAEGIRILAEALKERLGPGGAPATRQK